MSKESKVINTYYVAFWTRSDWLIGGACGLDRISQNQRCKALSTWGRKDSRLRFWLRTLPASTISFSLALCFFHVDRVDWLKLNCLQRSTAFTPQSNLPSISIFSLRVRSVCWRFTFERNILSVGKKWKKHRFYRFLMHLFLISHVEGVERTITKNIRDYIKECIYSLKTCRRGRKKGKPHTIHEWRSQWLHSLIRSRSESNSKS